MSNTNPTTRCNRRSLLNDRVHIDHDTFLYAMDWQEAVSRAKDALITAQANEIAALKAENTRLREAK
jgi:hypothetical protein